MDLRKYSYLWNEKKDEYVLINTEFGYGIVNKLKKSMLLIDDQELAAALTDEMLKNGNKVYDHVTEAFADA